MLESFNSDGVFSTLHGSFPQFQAIILYTTEYVQKKRALGPFCVRFISRKILILRSIHNITLDSTKQNLLVIRTFLWMIKIRAHSDIEKAIVQRNVCWECVNHNWCYRYWKLPFVFINWFSLEWFVKETKTWCCVKNSETLRNSIDFSTNWDGFVIKNVPNAIKFYSWVPILCNRCAF